MNNLRLRRLLKELFKSENEITLEGEENDHVVEISGVDDDVGWSFSRREGDVPDEWELELFQLVDDYLNAVPERPGDLDAELRQHFENWKNPRATTVPEPTVKTPLDDYMSCAHWLAAFAQSLTNTGITLPYYIVSSIDTVFKTKVQNLEPSLDAVAQERDRLKDENFVLRHRLEDILHEARHVVKQIEKPLTNISSELD